MDLVVREPGEALVASFEHRQGPLGSGHRQRFTQETSRLVPGEGWSALDGRRRHGSAHEPYPTPTWMSRKRAEEDPCAVRIP